MGGGEWICLMELSGHLKRTKEDNAGENPAAKW